MSELKYFDKNGMLYTNDGDILQDLFYIDHIEGREVYKLLSSVDSEITENYKNFRVGSHIVALYWITFTLKCLDLVHEDLSIYCDLSERIHNIRYPNEEDVIRKVLWRSDLLD